MASSLSNLVNNFSEEIHKIEYKQRRDDKVNVKTEELNVTIATNFKDDLIEYKCLCYNEKYKKRFDEKLMERLFNTCIFSKHDNNKFFYCC